MQSSCGRRSAPATIARSHILEHAKVQTLSWTWLHYFPGTAPYEEASRQGRLLTHDWRDYDGNRPVLRPARMPLEELEKELSRTVARFYGIRGVARRAWHAGMSRCPSQLAHHALVNLGMREYYAQLARSDPGPAQRYGGRPILRDRLEKAWADGASRLMDGLFLRHAAGRPH